MTTDEAQGIAAALRVATLDDLISGRESADGPWPWWHCGADTYVCAPEEPTAKVQQAARIVAASPKVAEPCPF